MTSASVQGPDLGKNDDGPQLVGKPTAVELTINKIATTG